MQLHTADTVVRLTDSQLSIRNLLVAIPLLVIGLYLLKSLAAAELYFRLSNALS